MTGELREKLNNKEQVRDYADQLKTKSTDTKDKYEKMINEISNKTQDMAPMQDRWKQILDLEDNLGRLQRQLTGKEAELKGKI